MSKENNEYVRGLEIANTALKAKMTALVIERDFWVEQGRSLQNQLQAMQRAYAGMFDQLGKGVVTDESIANNLALASDVLQQPIDQVEAMRRMVALQGTTVQTCAARSVDTNTSNERLVQSNDKRTTQPKLGNTRESRHQFSGRSAKN